MPSVIIGGDGYRVGEVYMDQQARIRNQMLAEAEFAARQNQIAQAQSQQFGGFRPAVNYSGGGRGGYGGPPGAAIQAQIRNQLLAQDRADQQQAIARQDKLAAQTYARQQDERERQDRMSQQAIARNDMLAREKFDQQFKQDEMNQRGSLAAINASLDQQRLAQSDVNALRQLELENKKYQDTLQSKEDIAEKNNATKEHNAGIGAMYKQLQNERAAAANGDPEAPARAAAIEAQMQQASRYAGLAGGDGESEAAPVESEQGPAPTLQGWSEIRERMLQGGNNAGVFKADQEIAKLKAQPRQAQPIDPVAKAAYDKYQTGRADKAATVARQQRLDEQAELEREDKATDREDKRSEREQKRVATLKTRPFSSLSAEEQELVAEDHPYSQHLQMVRDEFAEVGNDPVKQKAYLDEAIQKLTVGDPMGKDYRDELRKTGVKGPDMTRLRDFLRRQRKAFK